MKNSWFSLKQSPGRLVKVGLLALLTVIGFDFFLHGGVLRSLYSSSSPFLLPSEEEFIRIPLGYLSFAVLVALLTWVSAKFEVKGWKQGLIFGLIFGALTWGSFILGLFTISTASPSLLLGWFIGQTLELGAAGAVIGIGLPTKRLRRLLIVVVVFFVIMVILTIVLQNIGNSV
jgi:hypothetical protein